MGLTNISNDVDGNVNSIVVDLVTQTIYIGGDFYSVSGTPMNLVAGYKLSDGLWFSLRNGIGESTSSSVDRLIFNDGRLFAYGNFSSLYIFNFQLNIWNKTTPSSKIVSDLTLNDGVLLFCLEDKKLNFLFPGSITGSPTGIELTASGSLFQDGDSLIIGGVNRININSVRLATPRVSGFITYIQGFFATSSVRLFAGTVLTIGTFRTTVQEVTSSGQIILNPLPSTDLKDVAFVGRVPSLSDEITSVFFANALADYSLVERDGEIGGTFTISSTGVVTSDVPDIVIGTIITTTGNFRTKVFGSSLDGLILEPPLPTSLNGQTVTFTGRTPTILSLIFDILKLNPNNVYLSNVAERTDVGNKLQNLFNDFVEVTSIIPIRYIGNQNLAAENVIAANFIASTPEFVLLKYRVGQIDDLSTASIDTVLRVVFRQMLRSMMRRIFEIWRRDRDERVNFLKLIPGIPSRSICLLYVPKISFRGISWSCEIRITTPSVNFHDIAMKVSAQIDRIILALISLGEDFLDPIMGPDPKNAETPAFNYQ